MLEYKDIFLLRENRVVLWKEKHQLHVITKISRLLVSRSYISVSSPLSGQMGKNVTHYTYYFMDQINMGLCYFYY